MKTEKDSNKKIQKEEGEQSMETGAMAEEAKKEVLAKSVISVSGAGELKPKDQIELSRTISQIFKSGGIPRHYQSVEQVMGAVNFAAQLNLPWQVAIRNIAVSPDGSYMVYGDLPKGLAERTREIEEFKIFVCDKEYKEIKFENKNLDAPPFAAVCVIKRKGRSANSYAFTVADAQNAGLWERKSKTGKPSPWCLYPKVMLMRRAQAMAIRFEFPDALSGAAIAEYDYGSAPDLEEREVGQDTVDRADYINNKFKVPRQSTPTPSVARDLHLETDAGPFSSTDETKQ